MTILILLPTMAWAVCTGVDAYTDVVCLDNPCHYYRLDETSGTAAADYATNASCTSTAGTYTGGFTLSGASVLPSITDKSVTLNGSTGYVNVTPSTADFTPVITNNKGWSIEHWFNLASTSLRDAVSSENTAGTTRNYDLQATTFSSPGVARLQIYDNSSSCGGTILASAGFTTGALAAATPHQVVFTTLGNGTNFQHAKVYVDTTLVINITTFTGGSGVFCNNTSVPTLIGTDKANSFFTTGRMDEVSLYLDGSGATGSGELTQSQVTTHYNAGISINSSGWPYTVKRPELPHFRGRDYWSKFVEYGYNTGLFTRQARMPQFIAPYPTFDVVPNGNVQ